MSKFIALGAVLGMLAAGASAKTLKVTKSEVVEHPAVDVVQHRVPPAEPVESGDPSRAPATVPGRDAVALSGHDEQSPVSAALVD